MRYGWTMLCLLVVACGGSDPVATDDLGVSEVMGDVAESDLPNDPDATLPDGDETGDALLSEAIDRDRQ